MSMQKGCSGGGGRFGAGHSSKNEKPGYMSHVPSQHMEAKAPSFRKEDSMSVHRLSSKMNGGEMEHEEA